MNKKLSLYLGLLAVAIPSVVLAQLTCEELFNLTECNTCQKSLYDQGALSFYTGVTPPSQCPSNIVYGNFLLEEYKNAGYDVSHVFNYSTFDTAPFKPSLDKYCALEYTCDQTEVDQAIEKIKTDCATELSTPLDLTADPKTIEFNTLLAYATFLAYYGGIPSHESICLMNDQGEYCYYKIAETYFEYIKKESNGDTNVTISLDGKFLFLSDGTTKEIPKDLNCGECWTKIANIFLTYFEEHKLDEQLEKNIFGSYDEMKQELQAKCEDSSNAEGIDVLEEVDLKRSVRARGKRNARTIKRGGGSVTRSLISFLRG
ncbi:805_t:CDS:2 [Funneliformis caledonium]|uniref:805_t:CDS:1 n=1 Tax=Funneliformis caledonium TaxID=1117310 RepID=A0A9N9AV52_9GLOM|nr:805_t:CDS:2 [Funneliformis caledonium]